jgi:hypothetical protein
MQNDWDQREEEKKNEENEVGHHEKKKKTSIGSVDGALWWHIRKSARVQFFASTL